MTSVTLAPRLAGRKPLRRLRFAASDSAVLAGRNLIQTLRIPDLIIFSTIQPVMFVLLFRYVFGGAIQVSGTSYVNFLMPGIFVQTVAFGTVTTGISIAEDLQRGIMDRFRSLPMSSAAVLLGRTLADLVRNFAVVLVMLAVGIAVGFRPAGSVLGWFAAAALLMVFSFAFSWISALIGISVRTVEAASSAGFIWLFPLTFASSAFVPTDSMPGWLQAFANNQPVTATVDAMRGLLLGEGVGAGGWVALAWCSGILAVMIPATVWKYRRMSR